MLADDDTAVDADKFVVGESLAQSLGSRLVIVGLVVGGINHGAVDDEEVGIGSRKPLAVVLSLSSSL